MMNRRLLIIALIIACGFSASSTLAQKRGPSTPQERKRAVEIATLLENDPLNKNAEALSRELLIWLIEITTQLSFAEVKFVIEHPEQANDEYQVYLAGVESALKTYQNIKKAKPKVRLEPLEELWVKQQVGELPEFIKNAMVGCK
jgi:hypothetical protein